MRFFKTPLTQIAVLCLFPLLAYANDATSFCHSLSPKNANEVSCVCDPTTGNGKLQCISDGSPGGCNPGPSENVCNNYCKDNKETVNCLAIGRNQFIPLSPTLSASPVPTPP